MHSHLCVWFTLWLGLSIVTTAQAERHAVLIGVDYQDCQPASPGSICPPPLYGPPHDVAALKRLLIEQYRFVPGHIITLANREATKAKILETLDTLQQTTGPQDVIFIYFSGHGTSGADPDLGLDIAPSSGALVPADARVYVTDAARTVAGLIVGKDDLRQRFTVLERERQLLVIIDACYSGNTVRSLRGGTGIARYLPLAFTRSTTRNLPALPDYKPAFTATPKLPSPYANLIYISAADETELARDLLPGQTVDGLAHGALTNALLIGLRGAADTNHDGRLTYQELYQFLRREVYKHGHTPQLLAQTDLERPLFDVTTRLTTPVAGPPVALGPLRVKLEGQASTPLRDTLARLAGVSLTEASYDVLVTSEGRGYTLVLPNGDTLCSVDTVKDVAARLSRYTRVRELLVLTNPQQQFNVRLQVGEYAGKTVFVEGEAVDFTIEVERAAAVLLVSVDPHGGLTAFTNRAIPGARLLLQSAGHVEPPLGTEYFKLFAFTQPLPGLDQFTNRPLDPAGSEISELLRLIKNASDWAETLREIVTIKRP